MSPRPALAATPAFSLRIQAPLRLASPTYPERRMELAPAYDQGHNHSASLESAFVYVETPFAEQARLPLGSLSRGRMQFGAFYSFSQAENLLLGLPGAGSPPARSGSMQNHPGVTVPLADESYGFSVSIRLKRDAEPGPRIHVLRCLAWVLGARGCVSN